MSDFNVQVGTVFAGDFRIDRALSAGGMGAVYVAEQLSTGKNRALKVMLPSLVSDPALRKRFEQEARIGSLIQSEHIVEVVGAGIDPGTELPWLAMELLSGEDLEKVVLRRGPLPVSDVLALFEQLCHAVGAAHQVGVVHRDLKPENIFLAQARRAGASYMVKVLDFGIAKIVAEASTKQTAAMGSPIWMAPEQADQSPITPATDVWALGLIGFFLVTGRPYWRCAIDESATIPQVLKEVLFEPLVPASTRTAERGFTLPAGFDAWFAQCVAREPHRRFPDATQAGAALHAALSGAAIVSTSAGNEAFAATLSPGPVAPPGLMGTGATGPIPNTLPAPGTSTGPSAGSASAAISGTGVSGSYTIPREGQPASPSSPPLAPKKSSGAALGIVFAVLALGGLAAGGFWFMRHRNAAAPVATTAAPTAVAASSSEPSAGSPTDPTKPADDSRPDAATGEVTRPNLPQATLHQAPSHHVPSAPSAATLQDTPPVAIPTAPSAAAPTRSLYDLVNSTAPADWWVARRVIEPKVTAGTATIDEAHLLVTICKKQHDKPCVKTAEHTISGRH